MSDTSQGEGWWEASDGRWYPPEQRPGAPIPPPPPPPPVRTPSPDPDQAGRSFTSKLDGTSWFVLGGLGTAFVGSFMPWASAGFFTVNGTDGDGAITLVTAAIAAACYGYHVQERSTRRGFRVAALVFALITAFVYVYDFAEISSLVDESDFITVSPGAGIIIGSAGSVAAATALIIEMAKRRRPTGSADSSPLDHEST